MKDISCYRDMIIGTWVEQFIDGQSLETNFRRVHTFDRSDQRIIMHTNDLNNGDRELVLVNLTYIVNCEMISTHGIYYEENHTHLFAREEKVLRFTDSTLRVRIIEEGVNGSLMVPSESEVIYKKVSKENHNASTIQNMWELSLSSDPNIEPFRISFQADGSYLFYLKVKKGNEGSEDDTKGVNDEGDGGLDENEERWEIMEDEGRYVVFDSFLITSFFDNPILGATTKKGVAYWDISFVYKEKDDETGNRINKAISLTWSAVENIEGQLFEKYFLFTVVLPL